MDRKISDVELPALQERIASGVTIDSITKEYDCATSSVYRAFARNGTVLRSLNRRNYVALRNQIENMKPIDAVEFLLDVIEVSVPEHGRLQVEKYYNLGFTVTESKVLIVLEQHKGIIMGSEIMVYRLGLPNDRTLEVHVCNIRRKIQKNNLAISIKTIHGTGYMMEESK